MDVINKDYPLDGEPMGPADKKIVLYWWKQKAPIFLNKLEETLDRKDEKSRGEALNEARLMIMADANISKDNGDVQTCLQIIIDLIQETEEEIDYEVDSEGENIERVEEDS